MWQKDTQDDTGGKFQKVVNCEITHLIVAKTERQQTKILKLWRVQAMVSLNILKTK